ncbi:MAG: MFS transporter [Planctomycetes bacterium]|nr:MFS transporter [Planctomycetota bacterium]MBL7044216.1 MFS transporter [Pirellulaceae bacterium]
MSDPTNGSPNDLRRWQYRVFGTVWITYFAYYLCRFNLPIVKTKMVEGYGWNQATFGGAFTALALAYAFGQLVNGQLADRFGSRRMASLGVLGSVVMNLAVFFLLTFAPPGSASATSVFWLFIAFWAINGFFQAMGWSAMVRVMAHWFPTEGRGRIMGALGTCYLFGNAFAWLVCLLLLGPLGRKLGCDWQSVFLVPAVMFGLIGLFFFLMIRNRPEDVGLPPVDIEQEPSGEASKAAAPSIIHNLRRTVTNPYLWIVAASFFMLDLTRYGFVNWLPGYFTESVGAEHGEEWLGTLKMIMKVCVLPLGGVPGMLLAGWMTDKFFGGRRAPVIALMLLLLGILSIIFPLIDRNNTWLIVAVVAFVGFCTYGPHILMVGHAAQDFGKKSGAGGAAGFIDAWGYVGVAVAGVGAGALIDARGYQVTFTTFGFAAILGALLSCLIWKVGPKTE